MSGNLSRSMRENYEAHGVDQYYKLVGASYRNPHFPGIKQCIGILMNKWWQHESRSEGNESGILVCDLACGSGEVTIALQEWWSACQQQGAAPARSPDVPRAPVPQSTSTPPARPTISRPCVPRPVSKSGVAPLVSSIPVISSTEPAPRIYTCDAYRARTGSACIAKSFHDVAQDGLPEPPYQAEAENEESTWIYDVVICSFALHLLTSPSALYALLLAISYGSRWLVVLEPHKKPEIKDGWGWTLWDVAGWKEAETGPGKEGDFVRERVHCRVYKSANV